MRGVQDSSISAMAGQQAADPHAAAIENIVTALDIGERASNPMLQAKDAAEVAAQLRERRILIEAESSTL